MKHNFLRYTLVYFLLLIIFFLIAITVFRGVLAVINYFFPKTGTIESLLAEDPIFNGFNPDNINGILLSIPTPDNPEEIIDLNTKTKENINAVFNYLSGLELEEAAYGSVYIPSSGRLYFSEKGNTLTQEVQYILEIENDASKYFSLTRSHRSGYTSSYEHKLFKADQIISFEELAALLQ